MAVRRLYGEKALQCFADAHVCVVGIGGVGSWAAEALARTGIGAITLIDMDDNASPTQSSRSTPSAATSGLAKAEVMAGVFVSSTQVSGDGGG
ncbi:ThiF family adenylyltransferase [Klebsiella pneumoniae]|nr:ThiF family adenylyltransferase [Klebsiella pneumoniae]